MRKYFLLSAVALMAATSANAENSYGTVEVNADIKYVNNITCSSLELGTIYLDSASEEDGTFSVSIDQAYNLGGSVVRVDGADASECNFGLTSEIDLSKVYMEDTITLGNKDNTIDVALDMQQTGMDGVRLLIRADVTIPAGMPAGHYTKSFEVFYIE
ncbi:MAG: hypothetical protein E7016_00650 [Alphaproteobacteria bacterium]|nr:hypothetical protein [Alphaproteobacteria bacterium]